MCHFLLLYVLFVGSPLPLHGEMKGYENGGVGVAAVVAVLAIGGAGCYEEDMRLGRRVPTPIPLPLNEGRQVEII